MHRAGEDCGKRQIQVVLCVRVFVDPFGEWPCFALRGIVLPSKLLSMYANFTTCSTPQKTVMINLNRGKKLSVIIR